LSSLIGVGGVRFVVIVVVDGGGGGGGQLMSVGCPSRAAGRRPFVNVVASTRAYDVRAESSSFWTLVV